MENYMFGRQTTLNKLKSVRDDHTKPSFRRIQADQAMSKIIDQLKDKKLMALRESLIKATQAGDTHAAWKIENQIKAYEGQPIEVEE
jgi:hypothetical protein